MPFGFNKHYEVDDKYEYVVSHDVQANEFALAEQPALNEFDTVE